MGLKILRKGFGFWVSYLAWLCAPGGSSSQPLLPIRCAPAWAEEEVIKRMVQGTRFRVRGRLTAGSAG